MAHQQDNLVTGKSDNKMPKLLLSASGRYHCVNWFDDGGGNTGLFHSYLDNWTTGWVPNTTIVTGSPGVAGTISPALIQEITGEPNPGRIHCIWSRHNSSEDLYSSYSDDGVAWSSPALFLSNTLLMAVLRVIRTDTGRWLFCAASDAASDKLYSFYSDDYGQTLSGIITHDMVWMLGGACSVLQVLHGMIILAYEHQQSVGVNRYGIGYINSTDRGETWRTIVRNQYDATDTIGKPSIAELDDGSFICVYDEDDTVNEHIRQLLSTDGGYTWGSLSTPHTGTIAKDPHVIQLLNGVLLCAFKGASNYIVLRASNDRGSTWNHYGGTVNVTTASSDTPVLFELSFNNIICIYQDVADSNKLKAVKSNDSGQTWGSPITIDTAVCSLPTICRDADNNLVCVYESGGDLKIVRSSDEGATWGASSTILASADEPSIVKLADDNLHLAYTVQDGSVWKVSTLLSYDTGVSWHDSGNVFWKGADTAGYPAILLSSDGHLLCAFEHQADYIYTAHSPYSVNWGNNVLETVSGGTTQVYRPVGINLPDDRPAVYTIKADDTFQINIANTDKMESWYGFQRVYPGINPVAYQGHHDAICSSDDVLYAFDNNGGATIHTWLAIWNDDAALVSDFESYTGIEAPQIVTKWSKLEPETIITGSDGALSSPANKDVFTSAGSDFVAAGILPGDRIIISDVPPTASDGIYTIVEVLSTTQLKMLTEHPGGTLTGLDFRVVRNLPDSIMLRRKEYEYPLDYDDGNVCVNLPDPDETYDTFYADPGEQVLTGIDGSVSGDQLTSTTGGFNGVVVAGDTLIIKDAGDIRNNGFYVVESVDSDTQLTISRDFPLTGISNLDFEIWHGPFPLRTYYYTLFVDKTRDESLFGTINIEAHTWSFAGGTDMDPLTPTFKSRLWQMMPKVARDTDAHKLASTVDEVIEYNEVIYRDDQTLIAGHLERLARMYGLFAQRASDLIDNFNIAWNPGDAAPPVLEDLMTKIGAEVNRLLRLMPVNKQRKFLKSFLAAAVRKGIEDSMQRIVEFYEYDLEFIDPLVRGHFDTCDLISNGADGDAVSPNYFNAGRGAGTDGACYGTTDPDLFESVTGKFFTNGVKPSDTLTITGGANAGIYTVSRVISEIQLEITTTFPGGDTSSDTWAITADISIAESGDLLKIVDPAQEDNNGNWIVETVQQFGYDLEVVLNWTTAPLSGLRWELWRGLYFDIDALLDSYSTSWEYTIRARLYRQDVYQLWELEDTQLVFNEMLKFKPHNVTIIYNEEAP